MYIQFNEQMLFSLIDRIKINEIMKIYSHCANYKLLN